MSNHDIPEIDVSELARLQTADQPGAGATVFDVREVAEYIEAHVPGAILVPLSELTERAGEFPTDSTVYLICRSGGRSMQAAQFLVERGVSPVNVAGGTLAWIEAGHAVAVGSEPG